MKYLILCVYQSQQRIDKKDHILIMERMGIQDYVVDYIFDDDLVLLAEDGGNFGSKTKPIAYRVSGKCWVNNHAHVLKPKEGMNVDFFMLFIDVLQHRWTC